MQQAFKQNRVDCSGRNDVAAINCWGFLSRYFCLLFPWFHVTHCLQFGEKYFFQIFGNGKISGNEVQ